MLFYQRSTVHQKRGLKMGTHNKLTLLLIYCIGLGANSMEYNQKTKENLFFFICPVSAVTCHLSAVSCHLSPVTCHLSLVTCDLSPVT